MRQDILRVVMVLVFSFTWMAMLVGGGCNGPVYPDPINTAMTIANHDQNHFPTRHGASENPSGDCNVCHGGTSSFEDFTCLTCHAHEQGTTDQEHRGLEGYVYDSKSCYGCHPTGEGALGRDEHSTLYFPIDAASSHSDPSCAECHTTGDYTHFECIECHEHAQVPMADEHQGISDYAWESQACFGCHPNGESEIGRADHSRLYFPIDTGTAHSDNGCAECHTTGDYSRFECIECHEHAQAPMADEHQGVGDYQWESQSCLECHPSGVAVDRGDHVEFPIEAGQKHGQVGCGDCHTSSSYNDFSCIDCHTHDAPKMNSAHDDVSGYQYNSRNCYDCHPDSIVLTKSEHAPFFPITNGDHSRYGSEDCHKTQGTYQDYTCIGCHAGEHTCQKMNNEHQGEVRDYECKDSACLSCHPDGREDD